MYTLLFADDDDTIRKLFCGLLRRHGYAVLEAADGVEALWIGRDEAGPIHLLVTDIKMPKMGGMELRRLFASCHPESGVLFISGDSGAPRDLDAPFLRKPFTPGALLSKVTEVLASPHVPLAPACRHLAL